MSTDYFRWEQDADGIVVVTMDAPGKSANTMGLDTRRRWSRCSSGSRRP